MASTHAAHRRGHLAVQASVLALVVGGTTAFATLHKTLTLDVDGSLETVAVFGRTVGDVLASQGVVVGERDAVSPDPGAVAANDSQIVVRHGHELDVEIDGERQTVWSTALTVDEAITELGLRQGARTSAARSAPVGGDRLLVSTRKTVHVAVDGQTVAVTTAAATVREVLVDLEVVLGPYDQVSVPLDAVAVEGLLVMVSRVDGVTRSETVAAPFATVRRNDPTLALGREVLGGAGRDGSRVVTFVSYEVGGVEVGRTVLAERVVIAPFDHVIRVGTFTGPEPSSLAPVEPGTARAIGLEMVLARGWDVQQFACLDELWRRESNWRVNAENRSSGAYGIPQALPGDKMASAGADWRTNPATQITWGLGYIANRYETPCGAWAAFLSRSPHWY